MAATPTSKPSWIVSLDLALRQAASSARLRPALVGIGNRLNGDDAIGPAIIQTLQAKAELAQHALLVDGGTAPENATGALRRFAPNIILLIDAAEMGMPPGGIALLDWAHSEGLSASTHTLPPTMLAQYLAADLNCPVYLLGIQPLRLDFDAPLSPPVKKARAAVSRQLAAALHRLIVT